MNTLNHRTRALRLAGVVVAALTVLSLQPSCGTNRAGPVATLGEPLPTPTPIATRPIATRAVGELDSVFSTAAGFATATGCVSLEPTISIEGGTPDTRADALQATDQYVSNGFELPDLVLRLHDDEHGCDGHRGLFRLTDGKPVIDLCFGEELLALHELGHAWEYFNLDDIDRHVFQQAVGAPTWNSYDVPHKFRAVEIAAETMACGLLSTPATPGSSWNRVCARFEALTGGRPPRQTTAVIA